MFSLIAFVVVVFCLLLLPPAPTATAFSPPSLYRRHDGLMDAMKTALPISGNPVATRSRSSSSSTELYMVGRLFRRAKRKGVQTLEREEQSTTKKEKQQQPPDKDPVFRILLHNTEWQPEIVARIIAKIIPTLDRRVAYELCTAARLAGKVPLVIVPKKQAEAYYVRLRRKGLPVTMELHDVER